MIALASLLTFAKVNAIGSGAVLTLVLPLGFTLVFFVLVFLVWRRESGRRVRGE